MHALEALNEMSTQTARRMEEAIDEERTRISRDLHDTAGQAFVLVASRMGRLRKHPDLAPALEEEIVGIDSLVTDVLKDVRQTTHDMYPPALDHLGLKKALKQQVQSLQNSINVNIELECSDAVNTLSAKQSLQIFRIVQELVNNALKHSGASQINIDIFPVEDAFTIRVRDDGSWKDATISGASSGTKARGIGFEILRKRVELLAGALEISTAPNATSIEIVFPSMEGNE